MIGTPRFAAAALAATVLLLASGCDKPFALPKNPFNGVDVTGTDVGGELHLTDFNGKARSLADFRGKVVAVMFGYTQCPDVCPTTLAEFAGAMKQLGDAAARVQVLFVTVDPKRDTAELLREYVPAFYPTFLGLRGDAQATARATQDFHVYVQMLPGKTPDSYTVDHSSQVFIFDPKGRLRLMIPSGSAPSAIASDLRILLDS